jgi:hypothetical protein
MKNDRKDTVPTPEPSNFFEKLERATPAQASQSIIAQIILKLKKTRSQIHRL